MKRKYPSARVEYWQEKKVVDMYKKNIFIKDIMIAAQLSRNTVSRILEAHGIKREYDASESRRGKSQGSGSIIQQCIDGASQRHKRLTELFKPSSVV